MLDYVLGFQWTGLMGVLLYWAPAAFCVLGYTIRTSKNYMKDKESRDKKRSGYYPTDRVGTLIGRAVVSAVPVANIWAAMFDLSPSMFCKFFEWVGKVFNAPLVPDSEAAKARREQGSK